MVKTDFNGKTRYLVPKVTILIMAVFVTVASAYFHKNNNESTKIELFPTPTPAPIAQSQKTPPTADTPDKPAKKNNLTNKDKPITPAPPGKPAVKKSSQNLNTPSNKIRTENPSVTIEDKTKEKNQEENYEKSENENEDKGTETKAKREELTENETEAPNIEKLTKLVKAEIENQCKRGQGPICNSAKVLQSVLTNLENIDPETRVEFTKICLNKVILSQGIPPECKNAATNIVLTKFSGGSNPLSSKLNLKGEIGAKVGEGFWRLNNYQILAVGGSVSLFWILLLYLLLNLFGVIDWKFKNLIKQSAKTVPIKPPSNYSNQTPDDVIDEVLRNSGAMQKASAENLLIKEIQDQDGNVKSAEIGASQFTESKNLSSEEINQGNQIPETNVNHRSGQDRINQPTPGLFPSLVGNILNKVKVKESLVQYPLIKQALKKPSNASDDSVFSLFSAVYQGQLRNYVIPSYVRIGKEMEFSIYKEFFTTDTQFYSGDIEVIEPAEVIWDEKIRGWRLKKQGKLRFM